MHCTRFRIALQFLILVKRRGEREKKIIEKKMEERLIAIERETK